MSREMQYVCSIFGCGETIDGFADKEPEHCPHCDTELWPMNKGFTGNDHDACNEFARTHDMEGNPR